MLEISSEFYKNLLDNLYDGVYFVNPRREITYWNQGAARITGYTAQQTMEIQCRRSSSASVHSSFAHSRLAR
ncbi:MAG: hypothetical protein OHK0052_08980 [Anaerolineales bacterium]